MKQKLIPLLLVLCMMMTMLPAALASDMEEFGSCGEHVSWERMGDELTISGTGAMTDFEKETSPLRGMSEVTTVVIEEGVTSIGSWAFCNCTGITRITIPSSVKEIHDNAFYNCSALPEIMVPGTVTSIGAGAFSHCGALRRVTLSNGVRTLGDHAFTLCTALTDVSLPASLQSIGSGAFAHCDRLTGITIPSGVQRIGETVFSGCSAMTSIAVASGNTAFASADGVLYSRDMTALLACPAGKTAVTVPDSVTRIGAYAFEGCAQLQRIALPADLTAIGAYAFYGCAGLTEMTVPDGVPVIPEGVFGFCESLRSVQLPDTIQGLGPKAFFNCRSLTSVAVPRDAEVVGDHAFYGCAALPAIAIPEGVRDIRDHTFSKCAALREISFSYRVMSIGIDAFAGCTALTDVHYDGTSAEWNRIAIDPGNERLSVVTIHYLKQSPTITPDLGFTDVDQNAYYADSVNWAVEQGITNGTSETTFSPEAQCTRAQVVTFLWRANGSPKAKGPNPFADVHAGDYFYDAVLWAVERGITNGTTDTTFSPNATCTRGQVVTFQWRSNNSVKPSARNPFKDVQQQAYYYDAVLWAVEQGITNGTSDDHFSPDEVCTRGQVVTFLYRDLSD